MLDELPRWVYGWRGPSRETPAVSEKEASGYFLKRPFDAVVALIGLVIAAPLWIVFSLAIKLEDRGPVYFTQERWGRNKSKIRVYKFRSMVPNAVERFGNIQAQEHDPRVTRVGRLLRATSLDEMPQLLNIFKGDMSWVGPRALPIDEIQVREEERRGEAPPRRGDSRVRDPVPTAPRPDRHRPDIRLQGRAQGAEVQVRRRLRREPEPADGHAADTTLPLDHGPSSLGGPGEQALTPGYPVHQLRRVLC